mgnify:CR=1 FL=1
MKKLYDAGLALAVLTVLYTAYLYNFLAFHSLAELFSIIIGCGVFMVAWHSRQMLDNRYLLIVGIASLFVSLLDLAHTFSYKGMGVFPGYTANTATQLWIAARYVQSLTLLAAPLLIHRRIQAYHIMWGYSLLTAFLLTSIFLWQNFPDCFIETGGGLTRFKIVSEYLICLILFTAGVITFKRRRYFNKTILKWILASLVMTILSELAFTTYVSVYGPANLLGHYFKVIAFYCVYRAIIQTGLTKPYELLFRNLYLSRKRYKSLFDNMIDGFANHRMVYGPDGRPEDYVFLEVNQAFERLTGLKNVIDKPVTQVISGIKNDTADWIGVYGKVAATGQPVQLENYSESLKKWFSISAYSPFPNQFATIFEDITYKKAIQTALEKSESRFRLLADTSGRLLASDNPRKLIEPLCRKVMAHLDSQMSLYFTADSSENRFTLKTFAGITQEMIKGFHHLNLNTASDGSDTENADQAFFETISKTSERLQQYVQSWGFQGCCCRVLMVENHVIGMLVFGSDTRSAFTSDETAVIKTFSDYVAQAIHRVQTRSELQQANILLEDKVRERTKALVETVKSLESEIIRRSQTQDMLKKANQELTARAEELKSLTAELTMVEQRERRRLARVLHDGLQQHIAAAKFQISGIGRQLGPGAYKSQFDKIESMMGECIQMSRALSADLSPPVLHKDGLKAGLKWLQQWMQDNSGFTVDLCIENHAALNETMNVLVFESLRELLFNAVKHADVSGATVHLQSAAGSGLKVSVRDKGVGFNIGSHGQNGSGKGFGLFSIRKRITLMGGTFQIESTPGKGSCFTIEVPGAPENQKQGDIQMP